jgi:hypothetical protein
LASALCLPKRTPRAAGQGVTFAKSVEDLTADAPRGVGPERSAAVAAVPACGLHQTKYPSRDQVLAVGTATPRID